MEGLDDDDDDDDDGDDDCCRWCKNDPYLPPDVLQGDNYWECEAASVMLYSHLDRKDIIYADLDNQVKYTVTGST